MTAIFLPGRLAQSLLTCLANEPVELLELAERSSWQARRSADAAWRSAGAPPHLHRAAAPAPRLAGRLACASCCIRRRGAGWPRRRRARHAPSLDWMRIRRPAYRHPPPGCSIVSSFIAFGLLSSSREETVEASRSTNPTGGPTKLAVHSRKLPPIPVLPCRPRHFLDSAVRKCGENGPFTGREPLYASFRRRAAEGRTPRSRPCP